LRHLLRRAGVVGAAAGRRPGRPGRRRPGTDARPLEEPGHGMALLPGPRSGAGRRRPQPPPGVEGLRPRLGPSDRPGRPAPGALPAPRLEADVGEDGADDVTADLAELGA